MKIRVVLDNLSSHSLAPLYTVFEPAEARRMARKLELHFTPKHGSWLNAVEIEFSALSRQCLDRRVGSLPMLHDVVGAWTQARNQTPQALNWQFRTPDARVKLARLYPSIGTGQRTSRTLSLREAVRASQKRKDVKASADGPNVL